MSKLFRSAAAMGLESQLEAPVCITRASRESFGPDLSSPGSLGFRV